MYTTENSYHRFRYFWIKLTFELLTVRKQQHSFLTHERMFLCKCQSFWDRKCLDLKGNQTLNLRIHAECSNHLSYQGQTFAVPCFEHWLWRYRYFLSKGNIWTVNCARATAFIFYYIKAWWHLYVHQNTVIIGSGNDVLPVQCQSINWNTAGLSSIGPLGMTLVKVKSKYLTFLQATALRNIYTNTSHSGQAPMC